MFYCYLLSSFECKTPNKFDGLKGIFKFLANVVRGDPLDSLSHVFAALLVLIVLVIFKSCYLVL